MNVAPDDLPRSPLLEALIHLLRVERLEHNLFRGTSADIGSPSVFGGQVLSFVSTHSGTFLLLGSSSTNQRKMPIASSSLSLAR